MAKLELSSLVSLENQTSAVQTLNENFGKIEAALDNTLSRDGSLPNELRAPLDANGQRIINVGAPLAGTDAVRWADVVAGAYLLTDLPVPSLTGNAGRYLSTDGSTLIWATPNSDTYLVASSNLSDVPDKAQARVNLGLGTSATFPIGTAGSTIPLMDGHNFWLGKQEFAGGVNFYGEADVSLNTTPTVLTPTSIGFRGVPVTSLGASYTPNLNDAGRLLAYFGSPGATLTLPASSQIPYPLGTVLTILNAGGGSIVLGQGPGATILRLGDGASGNRNIAVHGIVTAVKISATTWYVGGLGLS